MSFFMFTSPWFLLALAALPAIWWLLRVTPPSPRQEFFPPFKILEKLSNQQQTAQRTPWWLLLLRLAIAACIIIGLAQPILKPKPVIFTDNAPLILIIDNGWASVDTWQKKTATAHTLLQQAEAQKKMVYLVATTEADNHAITAQTAFDAQKTLQNLEPRAVATRRDATFKALIEQLPSQKQLVDVAYLNDGLATSQDGTAFQRLKALNSKTFLYYQDDIAALCGALAMENNSDALNLHLIRSPNDNAQSVNVGAYDKRGRLLAQATAQFQAGATESAASYQIPLELRNDIAWFKLEGHYNAAGVFLTDSRNQRKRVALLAPSPRNMKQPLLSPFYYVAKALSDSSELIFSQSGQSASHIDALIKQNPHVIIIGDIAHINEETESKLNTFMANGGMLIRFAGSHLASASTADNLVPVVLRQGERVLDGIMSWETPQKLGEFSENGPFYGLTPPPDITINRQVLAEPTPELYDKTWSSLEDGTPLITAQQRGKGRLVFIHTAVDVSWSNLHIHGFFVEMLQRLVKAAQQKTSYDQTTTTSQSLKPWRILTAHGALIPAEQTTQPLQPNSNLSSLPTLQHPAGLYGHDDHLFAVNVLPQNTAFHALERPVFDNLNIHNYEEDQTIHLLPFFIMMALVLFAIDSFLALRLSQFFTVTKRTASTLALVFIVLSIFSASAPNQAEAFENDSTKQPKIDIVEAAGSTHLAYIITGHDETDETSQNGLKALSQFIMGRTTIALGDTVGLDLDKDELAFYPLIYWPITPEQPELSQHAIEKINEFMQNGGTLLFDTQDQLTAEMVFDDSASPASIKLRTILKGLNIPPLEPVSSAHVLSHAFYIMPDFPGRYRGSSLWIEALTDNDQNDKPIHSGDGVSPLLITANDLAGAWATKGKDGWKYPLIPDDQMQRVWAFRGGLNIVMYILTGNYKADQVHVPALLKRLGNEREN